MLLSISVSCFPSFLKSISLFSPFSQQNILTVTFSQKFEMHSVSNVTFLWELRLISGLWFCFTVFLSSTILVLLCFNNSCLMSYLSDRASFPFLHFFLINLLFYGLPAGFVLFRFNHLNYCIYLHTLDQKTERQRGNVLPQVCVSEDQIPDVSASSLYSHISFVFLEVYRFVIPFVFCSFPVFYKTLLECSNLCCDKCIPGHLPETDFIWRIYSQITASLVALCDAGSVESKSYRVLKWDKM